MYKYFELLSLQVEKIEILRGKFSALPMERTDRSENFERLYQISCRHFPKHSSLHTFKVNGIIDSYIGNTKHIIAQSTLYVYRND
jgi:hypothetical protein